MRPKAKRPAAGTESLSGWINAFLSDKQLSTPDRLIQWQHWAAGRLAAGWSPDQVKDRIRAAWRDWVAGGNVDEDPPDPKLTQAQQQVFAMAEQGASPEQCAVVYRSLANEYPERRWLRDWAEKWELAGADWAKAQLR